ncbi:MAG: 2,4-dihydroxyhept-2-ene-1,7-dioic acid aldolase [Chromatiales bacterium]|nr:2,4-dihydroxyhept-2-ene-1,7-dioic acid aldolase [Chromatiales bacterium]
MTADSRSALRARLDAGKPSVGLIVSMPSAHTVQTLARAGFDWVFIDMEHGPIDIGSLHAMLLATQGTPCTPLVRVPWNVHWLAKPVLDAGAMGVIFPMIRSAEEARAAASAVRYPPSGERGFGPFYGALRFGVTMAEYADPADRELMCVLLIEHRDAVECIDDIVQVAGVDVCLIAPFDLAMSYGHRDGPDHPEVQAAIARAEHAILASGKHLGGLALDPKAANAMIERGYRLILAGFDVGLLAGASADLLGRIQRG